VARSAKVVIWAAVWAGALPGCGGDAAADRDDGAGSGAGGAFAGDSVALEELAELAPAPLCAYYDRCYGPLISYLGGPDCVATFRSELAEGSLTFMAAGVTAGRLAYDGVQAAECLRALSSLECSTVTSEIVPCAEMLHGLVTAGNACSLTEECAEGLFCALDTACPGTCQPRAAIGGPCLAHEDCAEGLACDFSAQLCVAATPEGGICSTGDSGEAPCVAGTFCDAATGTCTGSAGLYDGAEGEACGYEVTQFCGRDLFCVADPGVSLAEGGHCTSTGFGAGAACRASTPEACPEGSYCAIPDDATDGTCQPLPGEGAPCTVDESCARGLACVTDTCRARAHLGAACAGHGQCFSHHCAGGACVAYDPCVL